MTATPSAAGAVEVSARPAERRFAIEAVQAASRLTRSVRSGFGPADATAKTDRSPVTVADLGAQALVRIALARALPADGLMGEEDSAPLNTSADLREAVLERVAEERPGTSLNELVEALDGCDDPGGPERRWWTLDPVDGTKGFLRNEQYAIALALIEDGQVVLAAMACPNLPLDAEPGAEAPDGIPGCLFVAEQGLGALMMPLWQADPLSQARSIRCSAPPSPAQARYAESVESAHSNQSESALVARALGITAEPVRLDSQTKYAVVARGDASIYLRLPRGDYRENVWDHAAGSLILSEAGGRVSDVEGKPLDLTTGTRMMDNRGIVATAASIHDEVVAVVRSVLGR